MLSSSLLPVLLLALGVVASPVKIIGNNPVTLPIARRFNFTGTATILQRDQARAAALRASAESSASASKRAVINQAVNNVAVTYTATIGIGNPATTYELLIDTGSSNTWVGAGRAYVRTSTSVQTANQVSVTYGSGSFSGNEFTDQVTITSGLVIPSQSIGVATTATGFDGFDGILGIGPVELTLGTLSPATNDLIPTVTDNLFSQGTLTNNEIGVSFNPTTQVEIVNGELTWGGTDSTKFTGNISFAPITSTFPSSVFWGIDQSITYGTAARNILSSTAGIVDTGTTLILLASNAITQYRAATGAVPDANTGLLRLTRAQFANLQSLFFHVNGVNYELTANGQIWPRALNTAIGGSNNFVYLIVADLGTPSGQGFDFVNGYTFLERFYSVYDTANARVGFATTPNTRATTN
jgi:cathepsin E